MSLVAEKFLGALGKPDPADPVENGLVFSSGAAQRSWNTLQKEIGAGWYRDHFLYLFGPGLETLKPCLEAWSFLVPPHDDRMILGRNVHGALLVLEDGNTMGQERVYVLDPFTVTYWGDPNMALTNTIGRFLPRGEIPHFLDDETYQEWVAANRGMLELEDVLGWKTPEPLGGTMTVDNLQLEGIVDYYRSTGAIYAKAFDKLAK